jgi:hypothetical protein
VGEKEKCLWMKNETQKGDKTLFEQIINNKFKNTLNNHVQKKKTNTLVLLTVN